MQSAGIHDVRRDRERLESPLVEKLNLAAQVGTTQLGATLTLLEPAFAALRAQIVAAGGDVKILDDIWQGFNTTAGRTNQAFEDLERVFRASRLPTRSENAGV